MNSRFKEIHSQWGIWTDIGEELLACHACPNKGSDTVGYHVVDNGWMCMRCKEYAPQSVIDVFELLQIRSEIC